MSPDPAGQGSGGPLAWVTWLRIVAIYAVVMIHTVGSTAAGPGSTTTVDGWVARALDFSLMWAVPVFVMLSGALALDPQRFRGTGAYLRKRVWRLVPAIVFWNVVYLAYLIATQPNWGENWRDALGLVLVGGVAPHLYFFWIVLGLSVITPALIPWVAKASRRACVTAAVVAWSVPVLSMWPLLPRGGQLGVDESAWTWWIPYLGAYLMGWALRGVLVPTVLILPAVLAVVCLMALLTWEWNNPAAPEWVTSWLGAHYYSPVVAVLSILIVLLTQTLIRPDGALRALTAPCAMHWATPLGEATMGIFALHFLVLIVGTTQGFLGTPETTWPVLLLRFGVVSLVTTAVVLLMRRVPVVRRVM
ncbi:acyltransferase [Ornithinimicrobium cavernae]|uniref:acyltransferase n=1 Tax=Ornithinimicrobium cavernae TaxID=2666047 RepID=UPI000D6869F4|nr:acyltransferase [Ornithinimicrobium cavernae]